MKKKILIIRFSSFGDIVQCMFSTGLLKKKYPQAEIWWLTRSDFKELVETDSNVHKVIGFDRTDGFTGLLKLAFTLRSQNFDLIYDAHVNLRSFFVRNILSFLPFSSRLVKRSKDRLKRFLFFKLKLPVIEMPFKGAMSFIKPLENQSDLTIDWKPSWSFVQSQKDALSKLNLPDNYIALVPSAAWELKRWPKDKWINLIGKLPHFKFVILGGPSDTFCQEIADSSPRNTINLAGKTSLIGSCNIVEKASLVITADTGLLHVADYLAKPCLALIGPTAFGFPSRESSKVLSASLSCAPCTKDGNTKCSNEIYQKCMINIEVESVAKEVEVIMS